MASFGLGSGAVWGENPALSRKGPLGTVQQILFTVPFERTDVYAELIDAERPLGVDPTSATIKVTRSHDSAETLPTLEPGCVREIAFASGSTRSELLALDDNSLIRWQELESSVALLKMHGIGRHKPTFTIHLADGPDGGTRVWLRYEFWRVEVQGKGMLDAFPPQDAASIGPTLQRVWSSDMSARGYEAVAAGPLDAPPLEDGFEVTFTLPYSQADVFRELIKVERAKRDAAAAVTACCRAPPLPAAPGRCAAKHLSSVLSRSLTLSPSRSLIRPGRRLPPEPCPPPAPHAQFGNPLGADKSLTFEPPAGETIGPDDPVRAAPHRRPPV